MTGLQRELLKHAMPWLVLAALLVVWEVACIVFAIPEIILPKPTKIFTVFVARFDILLAYCWDTLWTTVVGFLLAIGFGLLLGLAGSGLVGTAQFVAVPTALFLVVYLGCMAAAVRVLSGFVRIAAGVACVAVVQLLLFSGWAALLAAAVAVTAAASEGARRSVLQQRRRDGGCVMGDGA